MESPPLTGVWGDKYDETSRDSQRKMRWRCQCRSRECGKIAYFQIGATSSIFHPPPPTTTTQAVYGKTLHIHGPLVFENLSLGLFLLLRTAPSDRLMQTGHKTASKRDGEEGLGEGGLVGGGHLLSLSQHPSMIHTSKKHTRFKQDSGAPHPPALGVPNAHTDPPPPPRFASTHRSLPFAWVKSSKTPGLVLDLPPTSACDRAQWGG